MKNLLLTICLLSSVISSSLASEPLQIELLSEAQPSDPVMTLGMVAKLSGGSPELQAGLRALDIGEVPVDGKPLSVSIRQVEFRLRLAGLEPKDYRLLGAKECIAQVKTISITVADAIDAARAELHKRLGVAEADVEITLKQPVSARMPNVVPGDRVEFRVVPHSPILSMGRCQMNVTVLVRGQQKLTFPVYFEARQYQSVAISTQAISLNSEFDDQNIRFERRVLSPQTLPAGVDGLLKQKANRNLPAGTVILQSDVKKSSNQTEMLVQARQRVKVQIYVGPLKISTFGEAMQGGQLGQTIRVKKFDSNKIVSGKVVAEGIVEVDLRGGS